MLLAKDLLMASGGGDFPTDPVRFDYTGSVQTYTVPKGCKALDIDCVGAKGGDVIGKGGLGLFSDGGNGGRVQCRLSVSSEQILYIYVGNKPATADARTNQRYDGGWNGGGYTTTDTNQAGLQGGGGGASDIRTVQASSNSWYDTSHSSWDTDISLLSRLVVAGAGGGAAASKEEGEAGHGGGLVGGTGFSPSLSYYAYGGTQTAGGTATPQGTNGDFGKGADTGSAGYGGGGGSGWYGGAAAIAAATGGGSSYTHPTLCTNVVHTQGYSEATGNGWVIITPVK